MKLLFKFIYLWIYFGCYKEAWNDTKFIFNKKIQKELQSKIKYYEKTNI